MSSIFNSQNIERMRVNGNEIALAKINGKVVFQKNKLLKTFFGDSKQNTTSGKNLFDVEKYVNDNSNYYHLEDENLICDSVDTRVIGFVYTSFEKGTYTVSTTNICNTTIFEEGSQYFLIKKENVNEFTFTLEENKNLHFKFFSNDVPYEIGNIQIEKGSMVTEYESYTGGKPSPNPDYPQKISSINGVNLKLIGKNLYNNEYTNNIVSNEGIITSNPNWNMSDYIEIEPNKSYTFSHNDENSTGQSLIIAEFDENKNFIKRNSQGNYNYETYEPYTIITNSNTKFIILNYNNTYNNSLFQLEKGSQVTTYEPYKNQIIPINLQNNILAKVGDYADELQVYSNGDVKIVKKIGKYILNDNTGYVKSSYSNDKYFKGYILEGMGVYLDNKKIMNTHFQRGIYSQTSEQEMLADTNQLHIQILASRLSENSVKGLQEWLGKNNVTVLIPLTNQTTTKIQNIKEELNSFGDYSNIEIETTYE